ncbi:Nitrite reductase [NAD(P)H] [Meiothermus luteus]|jgi:nitrite reductase (NADH) large subunit|uniref:Nitrite reductase [NAD(P)H] n=1 Tax=Meiothermus luteus TaxID=2026184 RepID=A0A399F0C0_9DEIN|nr:nitrite reductase large subunit NirB [Meiothermus luteus]RIH89728.1 Nitrite reductase [NAD(P)H] [Meiothermus luteus]RMH57823.1 MAG: nitrite reductase large subunit [Deinococcota bacterium]
MLRRIVVVGNGMVGHKFLETLRSRTSDYELTVIAEEPCLAYDRVRLSAFFEQPRPDLSLGTYQQYQAWGVRVINAKATGIDRERRVVQAEDLEVGYDILVLATGSYPFVPPIEGRDLQGCFTYRTLEDLTRIEAWARHSRKGVVIGGGLLGLEAAGALLKLGLETHVVELASHLMPLQLDELGGRLLRRKLEAMGIGVHVSKSTQRIEARGDRVAALRFADGSSLEADLVIFSAGIRPRDELARQSGLKVGERGGIVIDEHCRTSDPHIYAIGECALYQGRIYGLVAPGYEMARVLAEHLTGGERTFSGADLSTKLKLLGVEVGSFGDAFAQTPGAREVLYSDFGKGVYKKLVLSEEGRRLLGGILVGDASDYANLHNLTLNAVELDNPEHLLIPPVEGRAMRASLPMTARVCSCENVTKGAICEAIRSGCRDIASLKKATRAGTGCGGCVAMMGDVLKEELLRLGEKVSDHLCEHFPYSRRELFDIVRVRGYKTFEALLRDYGKGYGCEVCKPAVASILASLYNEHVLEEAHVPLQDTNDRFLANMQRDGTYSVVPRIPGGEITPDKLIAIGQVAKKYGLYTKITGGQRVDLFGARLEQLPHIWADLIAAGFESGHAYGKALRTVKSCVGDTWCRYGVQDSVGLAIRLENRYKGLRAPHKIKMAVSGCTRECAEAQSKDVGVIATERGWNLYVCGNGGMKPRHADLLAADLDEETLVRYIDRFLMFYIRTADRLQRTSVWLEKLEGGLEYLREVIVEDKLGLAAELEAQMAHHIQTYRCEWKATLESPEKLKHFRHFINSDAPDDNIVMVEQRGQHRPAYDFERETLPLPLATGVKP